MTSLYRELFQALMVDGYSIFLYSRLILYFINHDTTSMLLNIKSSFPLSSATLVVFRYTRLYSNVIFVMVVKA